MKRWMRVILGTMMAVMCAITATLPALAAEDPGVSIPVTVSLSGTLPKTEESFKFQLQADDEESPMPAGTEDGICTLTVTGAGTENFPSITYDEVGVYTYRISQVAGKNKKCTYDETVYALTVTISNAEDGSGLESTAVLYPDNGSAKQPGAEFKNEYEVEATATPTPTAAPTPTATPTPTETPAPTQTTNAPKTGDDSTPGLFVNLLVASLAVAVVVFLLHDGKKAGK